MNFSRKSALFGMAGKSADFIEAGHKSSTEIPKFLADYGLNAFEYQCGNGINIKRETAQKIGDEAAKHNISLSVHAPYYISMCSGEEIKRENSVGYVFKTAQLANWMGAKRIVVHIGGQGDFARDEAFEIAKSTLKKCIKRLDDEGLGHIHMCIENMGTPKWLAQFDEVIKFCKIDERLLPCIDFGHLNCVLSGGLNVPGEITKVFEKLENELGFERTKYMHIHFTKMEHSNGIERRHLTNDDTEFGPYFDEAAEVIARKNLMPTVISESAGTQSRDALEMKKMYEGCQKS